MLERYVSSAFNESQHRPPQEIDGPSLEVHIESNVKSRVCYAPSQIMIQWQNKVEGSFDVTKLCELLKK